MNGIGKTVVVESPYREAGGRTRIEHTRWAERLCRALALAGHAPFASHLYCPAFLDEDRTDERQIGIEIQKAWIARCDRIVIWDLWGVSPA